MYIKGIKALTQFFLLIILIDRHSCQYTSSLSPDLQYKAIELNISDGDFEGQENINKGVSYGLWSRYNPLSSILKVGNIGIFDSNCFHYLNAADKETKRINMLYYDCLDYEKRTITKTVEFIDNENKLHVFQMHIKSDEYENEWYAFIMITLPQLNKLRLLMMSQKNSIIYQELSIKYPFHDKDLTITFGGGLNAIYNSSLIQYSYFPGKLMMFSFSRELYYNFSNYDLDLYNNSKRFRLTEDSCEDNEITTITESVAFSQQDKIIYNSQFSNYDYFQFVGWIRILKVINPKSDQNYKIIKISVNSLDDRLTNDDLSPFQLYYKISNSGNSIIFTTYSYTFPTVNLNAINEKFLILVEQKLLNSFYNWHHLSVQLRNEQFNVEIEFYEGILSQIYSKSIRVNQFHIVNLHLQLGNILNSVESYLNLEMRMVQFFNCNSSIKFKKCFDASCSTCVGPSNNDCQNCLLNPKKIYLAETKQCVCSLDTIDQGNCLNVQDLEFSVVKQINEQFSCPYGYFTVNYECYRCPSIISDSSITCLECLNNPLIWHTMMYCSSQLVSYNGDAYTYETLKKMYYIFDGVDIYYCNYCTDICISDCINRHLESQLSKDDLKCSFKSAFSVKDCFSCDISSCQICNFSISRGIYCVVCNKYLILQNGQCVQPRQPGQREFCYDNCAYCRYQQCQSCYPPYYLTSDKNSCKKCPIQNCRFCFEFKTNDLTKNTIFKDFQSFEFDEYLSIGCSLCDDGYNYDFQYEKCIKGFPLLQNCIRSYVNLSGEEKCLLSAIDDFSIAPQIVNCEQHIINCDQCVLTTSQSFRCIICKPGYSSQVETGLCNLCQIQYSKVCIQQDYQLQDYWIQLIQQFIVIFFSNTYYYPQPSRFYQSDYPLSCMDGYYPTREGQCVQYCDEQCQSCIQTINNDFYCRQCPKTQYGISSLSISGKICLQCSKYCVSCQIRSEAEIQRINPQFVLTSANKIYTYICLMILEDYRIKLDQKTQIAYYCLDQDCSRSIEHYIHEVYYPGKSVADQINTDFCNQMGIKELHLTLNLLHTNNIHYPYKLENPFKRLIFSLQTTILKLKGSELNILQNTLNFTDFDIIVFSEIKSFIFSGSDQFNFSNINKSISLHIKNTYFFSESNSSNFQIKASLFKDLTLNNVTFYQMNLKNVIWLEYVSDLYEDIVEITYLRIENCTFENTTLMSFIKYSKSIHFQVIEISNCYFSESTFFQFNTNNLIPISLSNFVNNLSIRNCTFNFSTFIKNLGDRNIILDDINIYQNNFQNSFFMESSFQTTLRYVKIKENIFQNSTFFISTIQSGSTDSIEFLFKQFTIEQNFLIQSKLLHIYQQNENKIIVKTDGFIQDEQQQEQIKFEIQNQSFLFHVYDFSCTLLYVNNFTFHNTQSSQYFKIYQTNKIIISNIIFSNQHQIYKISVSTACNLAKVASPVLIYIQGFAVINIKKISISNQFSIDSSLIKIQSDLSLQSSGIEIIRIEEITFKSNILLKNNLANLFSLLVIYSERIQNIYLKDLTFQENFFHQFVDDPSQVGAGLIYLNSFQSSVVVDGITCLYNGMTNSSYSFIALNSLTIGFNLFTVNNHNFLNPQIWQKYYQIELDFKYTQEVVHSFIDQIFGIKTIGGILQIVSSELKIQNSQFSNILAQSTVAFAITTQGKGIIEISNVQILRAQVVLLQTSSSDGCITISSVTSLLNLHLQNINFQEVYNRFGSAILTITPSLKQNSIVLMNITISNSFSLFNQITKILFSITSTESNQVFIENLNFIQNSEEFNKYLQTINFPSITEVRKIKGESSIITLQGCKIIIKSLYVTGILISPLLMINDAQKLIILQVKIQQVQVLYPCRLLSFTFTESNAQNLIAENIIFQQVSLILPMSYQNNQMRIKYFFSKQLIDCLWSPEILKTENINQTIFSYIDILNQISDYQGSFIYIGGLTYFSKVQLQQIDIRNNNCSFCYEGIIQIKQLVSVRIKINYFLCYQNQIQKFGCLSLMTEQFPDSSKQYSIIKNSRFFHNFGEKGVGMLISKTPFQIKNTFFIKNYGSETGGAISVSAVMTPFKLNNTMIIENQANFGGGIYLESPNYLSEQNFIQSLIQFNKAQILSNNLVEAPDHLILQINNEEMSSIVHNLIDGKLSLLSLKPYKLMEQGKMRMTNFLFLPSNQKLSNYQRFNEKKQIMESYIQQLSLFYKNVLNEIQGDKENDNCQLFSREVSEESKNILGNYTLIQNFSFSVEKNYFDLSSIIVKFDPYSNQERFLQLLFNCQTTTSSKQLLYQINAKTFKCQLGEFYTNNGCQYCEPNYGFYSVEYDVVKCSIFDVNKLENITSNLLKLRMGYWRPNYFSNEIELCFKDSKHCIGGWKVGNDLCFRGHIGGLCEECDQLNIRGDGNFVKIGNTVCGSCSNDSTLLPFFFLFLWSFISILFTLKSIRKTNKTFVILKTTTQLFQILFKLTQDFESIFLKMLLNYLWLFSVIFAFNISFNFSLSVIDSISSPNVSMATNLDCQLLNFQTFQLIYLRIIITIILLIFQILIILVGSIVHFHLEKTLFDYSVISNLLIYLYVSNQAQLIKSFGSMVAIRTISDVDYIQGDVSLLFYEQDHITCIYVIILPSLIITGLLIPLFFLTLLIFNKNKFTQTDFRKHLGYLFNEYNQKYSYWEQIKIFQRSVIIIIITYFETDIYIKASLMSLTLIAYIIFAVSMKPYIIKSLNKLDFQSCCLILISIFLAIVEYIQSQQSNNITISMILQIIMLLLCLRTCHCFISRIISLYYKKYQLQVFFHLKNFAQQSLKNQIVYKYLNIKYVTILLRKQKLKIHLEKLREWYDQYRCSIRSRKLATLTDFVNSSIAKDKNLPMKSLVPRLLMI